MGQGVMITACLLVLSRITSLVVKAICTAGGETSMFHMIPDAAVYAICAFGTLLIFNSFVLLFATYNKTERAEFLEKNKPEVRLFTELSDIIRSKIFLAEAITCTALIAFLSFVGVFSEFGGMFYPGGSHSGGWLPTVMLAPTAFLIMLFAKYEVHRHLWRLNRNKELHILNSRPRLALRIVMIALMYPIVYPLFPILIFMIITLGSVIITLTNALSVIGFIAAIAVIVLAVILSRVIRAVRCRKKFLRRLREVVADRGYVISDIKNPYLSIIRRDVPCSFTLEYDGMSFGCIMISGLYSSIPLIFSSPTDAYFECRLGTKKHHVTAVRKISFYPIPDTEEIVIVNPAPRKMFVTDGIYRKTLTPGDKIWSYIVTDADSFIGGADRKCLNKHSGTYH